MSKNSIMNSISLKKSPTSDFNRKIFNRSNTTKIDIEKAHYEAKLLLDEEEVKTDSLSCVPCKLYFKGQVDKLPENAQDGDCYVTVIKQQDGFYCWEDSRTFYWYDNQWNELKNPPKECRINYV